MKITTAMLWLFVITIALSACGGEVSLASNPPTAASPSPTATALPPTATTVPATDTPPPIATPAQQNEKALETALPEGDPLLGELTALNYRCTGCHDNSVYPNENGPEFAAGEELPPILERAQLRLSDPAYNGGATTGQEYLVESILNPEIYVVSGDWLETMPVTFHEDLTAQ
ncbi:MAG: hypothetical protein ACK2UP_16965, partial [Candidatus Promineifilaceae bacterium]